MAAGAVPTSGSSSREFRDATSDDIARLERTLRAGRVFANRAEAERARVERPWALQVSERGEVVALSRWREHVPLLAIDALWCAERRIAPVVLEMTELAQARGYEGVVSPPVPVTQVFAYERAGMRVHETLVAYRHTRPGRLVGDVPRPSGSGAQPTLRAADPADVDSLLALDARCFDEFWRYDRAHLAPFVERGECVVLESAHGAIGYTLSTHERHESLLGRVGVDPAWRRQGFGALLVRDAVARAIAAGAGSVTLVTQVDNVASRALYEGLGFRDTGSRYAFLRSG